MVVQQLDDLNAQLSKAEAERLAAEAELRTVEQHGVEALPDLAKNTTFHELQVQLAVADGEYARMAAQFKPSYWGVAELKSKADKIRTYLEAEVKRVGKATRSTYRAAREREDRLRARFEEQKRQALEQKDAGVEYALLLREAETNRALYDSVLQRMKEMTVAVEVCASNMSVADRAVPPSAPSGAGRMKSIGFAALLAAIAGVVLSYVRDAVDDAVKTAHDIERWGRMPTLAVVPDTSVALEPTAWWMRLLGRGPMPSGPTIVVRGAARPACTDAYRELRTALMLSRPGGPPRTLLVASGSDAEGRRSPRRTWRLASRRSHARCCSSTPTSGDRAATACSASAARPDSPSCSPASARSTTCSSPSTPAGCRCCRPARRRRTRPSSSARARCASC